VNPTQTALTVFSVVYLALSTSFTIMLDKSLKSTTDNDYNSTKQGEQTE